MRRREHVAQNEREIHVQGFGEGTRKDGLEDIFIFGKIILKLGVEK
jgi:hypothetical protein